MQHLWCKRDTRSLSCRPVGVELGHQFAVGGACGVEILVAFVELEAEIDRLLFEVDDPLFELVDVVGGAEAGFAPGLFAEDLRESLFELADSCGEADRALLGGEQVCLQRGPAGCGGGAGGGLGGLRVNLAEEVAVSVEEGAG
jgi:hypothetical protein